MTNISNKIELLVVFAISLFSIYGYYLFSEDVYLDARAVDSFSTVLADFSSITNNNRKANTKLHSYLEGTVQEGSETNNVIRNESLNKDLRYFDKKENYSNSILLLDNEKGLVDIIKITWSITGVYNIDIVLKLFVLIGAMTAVAVYMLGKTLSNNRDFHIILLVFYLLYLPSYSYLFHMRNHWFVLPASVFLIHSSIVIHNAKYFNKKIFLYLIGISLLLGVISSIRSSALFLIILPIISIIINKHIHMYFKIKYIFVLLVPLIMFNGISENKGHSLWFPVFVGMGEAGSGFIPSADDGYAFHYNDEIQPRTTEWNEALKSQVIRWYIDSPEKIVSIYKYRINKIFNPDKFFLWGGGLKKVAIIFMLLTIVYLRKSININYASLFYVTIGTSYSLLIGLVVMVKKHSYYFVFDLLFIILFNFFHKLCQ